MEIVNSKSKREDALAESAPSVAPRFTLSQMSLVTLDKIVEDTQSDALANRVSVTPTGSNDNSVDFAPIPELQENELAAKPTEEEKKPLLKSPQRRKERMRRSVKQTLQLSFTKQKSFSGGEDECWVRRLPAQIVNSANARVAEADLQKYADIDNSFETKYEVKETIGEVAYNSSHNTHAVGDDGPG